MTRHAMIVGLVVLLAATSASAQIKKMVREGAPAQAMTAAETSQLNDPLFLLALKANPNEGDVQKIVDAVKGTSGQSQVFVVDELIANPAKTGTRRAVVAFRGSNQNMRLDPNIMLSIVLTPTGITPNFIEAWGWDGRNGRYNYYKFQAAPGEQAASWKFRDSSVDADIKTLQQRKDTCLACHINGEPLMKELLLPWNNWNSTSFRANYLTSSGTNPWQVATRLATLGGLAGAQQLETDFMLSAIRAFNARRVDALIKRNAQGTPVAVNGMQEITDGGRLLRPLFDTTQYNLISSGKLSGLHPIPAPGNGPVTAIDVPASFFLNANLMAGGGRTQYQGVGVGEASSFGTLLSVAPNEYSLLVSDAKTKVGGKLGDSNFAWFVPEPSHIDNQLIDLLVRRGVVTKQFAAAALAVDVETPVFSTKAPALLKFIPPTFRFKPLGTGAAPPVHPDALTQAVIANLKAAAPGAGTPAADFLALLQNPDPVDALRQRVTAYRQRVESRLKDPMTRRAELQRLFQLTIDRRRTANSHPVLRTLVESDALFPLP